MNEEIETIVRTEDGVRVAVSQWSNDSVWLSLQAHHATMHVTFTRAETEQLFAGLKAILDLPVAEQSPQS